MLFNLPVALYLLPTFYLLNIFALSSTLGQNGVSNMHVTAISGCLDNHTVPFSKFLQSGMQ